MRVLERAECVDVPLQLRVSGNQVILRDCRKWSRPVFRTIDPVSVEVYEQKGAITLRNGKTRSVWNMFLECRSGRMVKIRFADKYHADAAEKKIVEIIRRSGE